jgi:hypothetical protein
MKHFLVLFLLAAQSLVTTAAPAVNNSSPGLPGQNVEAPADVIVELVANGRHLATWDVLPGSGNYNIGIVNLDTNQTHAVITSPTNSAIISGLVTGNTYQFTIVKNGYIIIDIIDL